MRVVSLYKLFGILLHGDLSIIPQPFIQEFIYINMDLYVYFTLFNLLLKSFERWEIFQLIPVSLQFTSIIGRDFFFFKQLLITFWHYKMDLAPKKKKKGPGSYHVIIPVAFLESATSPWSLGFFYRTAVFKTVWYLKSEC